MLPIIRRRIYNPVIQSEFPEFNIIRSFFSDGADYSVPATNIRETDTKYVIELAAPGMSKKDFNVHVENDIITVSTEHSDEREYNDGEYTRREFFAQDFERSFSLPDNVDQEKIVASYKNGILSIELPKVKESVKKQRTISIG